MIKVLLIHAGEIPHYRIPIYSYLSTFLEQYDFELVVLSDGVQPDNPHPCDFQFEELPLSFLNIIRFLNKHKFDVIIDYMELRHLYLFPIYFVAKGYWRMKMIYWGQGRDLLDPDAKIKNLAYATEQAMCDAIILYAEHLKKYVPRPFHKKVFVAHNTIHIDYPGLPLGKTKVSVLEEYGIYTQKNIICMGRIQKRKRLSHLVEAFRSMNRPDIGLILIGPDPEGILDEFTGDYIYKLGPIYGDKKFDLLSVADVYCLPGAVGLSIVDAFYCGLPMVTEDGDESAEIMYLKNGLNGYIVPKGNTREMAQKLLVLLDNDELRRQFSSAAKKEIMENGSIEKMCAGFRDALCYVTGKTL